MQLAMQFATSHPDITTTLVGTATEEQIRKDVTYAESPIDFELMAEVLKVLRPVKNRNFTRGRPENRDPIIA